VVYDFSLLGVFSFVFVVLVFKNHSFIRISEYVILGKFMVLIITNEVACS
jgi:hypothetical protein